jgi:flagella basal body P-ring formation protein FlgA
MSVNPQSHDIARSGPFLLIALLAFAPGLAVADSIQLRARASVTDSVVRLADVAALEGDIPAAHADTVVARLEATQTFINLSQDSLKQQLGRAGVNWARVALKGFENCEVTRGNADKPKTEKKPASRAPDSIDAPPSPVLANPTEEIGIDAQVTVRQRIGDWLRQLHGICDDSLRIAFAERDAKALDALVAGDRLVLTSGATTNMGRVPVTIQRFRGEKLTDTQRLTIDVARRQLAVVAAKAIARGAVVLPDDVEVREVFIDRDKVEVVAAMSDAVGQVAAQPLRVGAVLLKDMVRPALLVRRNEVVQVQALAGGFMVQTEGRALEDGGEGDVIEVRNERSRDTFTARVVALKRVLVTDAARKDVKPTEKQAENKPPAVKQGSR